MTRCFRMLCLGAAIASAACAQKIGDLPPALVWDKLKGNCPESLDWTRLQGKVVVVSLCAEEVSPDDVIDWNEAPQELKSEPVVFLQVVSRSEFLLDQALERTSYRGCILFDSKDVNRKNFKQPNLPRTVIVDALGYIAGYFHGGADAEDVRSVLKPAVDSDIAHEPPPPTLSVNASTTSYEVHIAPASPGDRREFGSEMPDAYVLRNHSLKLAVSDAWDTSMARISFPKDLDSRDYNITAHIPIGDRELLVRLVQDAIQKQLGLQVKSELRVEHVYMLTAANNTSSHIRPAHKDEIEMTGGGVDGSIMGTSQTMQGISRVLEDLLEIPVLDETGLSGKYDYSALTHLHRTEATLDIAHQLGLELTMADRPIQMLVVTER